jgi:hypothetical protein
MRASCTQRCPSRSTCCGGLPCRLRRGHCEHRRCPTRSRAGTTRVAPTINRRGSRSTCSHQGAQLPQPPEIPLPVRSRRPKGRPRAGDLQLRSVFHGRPLLDGRLAAEWENQEPSSNPEGVRRSIGAESALLGRDPTRHSLVQQARRCSRAAITWNRYGHHT